MSYLICHSEEAEEEEEEKVTVVERSLVPMIRT